MRRCLSYIFSGFILPLFFALPLAGYLTGYTLFVQDLTDYLAARGIYFLLMAVTIHVMFRGQQPAKQFRQSAGLFPLYFLQTVRALFYPPGRKPRYRVNNAKNERSRDSLGMTLLGVAPQALLIFAHLAMPFYAIWAETAPSRVIAGNMLLSAFTIWVLTNIVVAALRPKKWPHDESPQEFYGARIS